MEKKHSGLVLLQDDYEILLSFLRGGQHLSSMDKANAEELHAELKKATLVEKAKFPIDVVRLNSVVKIKDEVANKEMEFTIVTPDLADIKQKKISVMAPIGTALIGFRKGQKVKWNVPAGEKTFLITEVINAQA